MLPRKISEGEFTVVDELDRYYSLKSNGRIKHIVDGSSTANTLKAGIYWIKIDFSAMTYTAVQVSMIEYYAASWADNSMSTVYKTLTYKKGKAYGSCSTTITKYPSTLPTIRATAST